MERILSVGPSVQSVRPRVRTGWTAVPERGARDGRAGPVGVSGGAIRRIAPGDKRALQVIDGPYR